MSNVSFETEFGQT